MKTDFLRIGSSDLVKGAILASLAVIVTGATEILTGLSAAPPVYPTMAMLGHLAVSGLTTGGIYLLKNLLTNNKDQFLKKDA